MSPVPQPTPTGPGTQAGRARCVTALMRLALQMAIREELAAMAEASAAQAAAKQGAQQ